MIKLLMASFNLKKIKEVEDVLAGFAEISGLSDLGFQDDIPETGITLSENAFIKARFLSQKLDVDCFADDSGLEVEALNGAPGVYSARYAGEPKDDLKNLQLLLENMKGEINRKAAFRTVIALIIDSNEYLFEGKIEGRITNQPLGTNGFGYDAVFIPDGHEKTFAQMTADEKNKISHRAIAVEKMRAFLSSEIG